jgi:hypothetical protein
LEDVAGTAADVSSAVGAIAGAAGAKAVEKQQDQRKAKTRMGI